MSTKNLGEKKIEVEYETETFVMEKIVDHKVNKAKITRPYRKDKRCTELDGLITAAMVILGNRLKTNHEGSS